MQTIYTVTFNKKVFFYSSSIFKDAGLAENQIQYAILTTGIVNVLTTIICVPLIDRLGRKPLLIYPMVVITFDFMLLTICLAFQVKIIIYFNVFDFNIN
jgi:MFS family permease